ncbi:hypothetical protein [Flavobacterium sp. JP2137]|uniref:hypothetical protein n=1 Tax=Flavobacterium sp. JP2137 TaxID=3414510 RepID=UPI003D300495
MKYITILMLFITINVYSQEVKNINFIIVIDEEIITNSLGVKLLITSKDESSREIKTTTGYYPGNISLRKSDYDDLISDETQSVILKFNYQTYIKDKSYYYTYEIEAGKNWFNHNMFFILKVYNLDKKKYRKRFDPLSKDKNYTFELNTSEGQMLRIKKR